MKDMWVSIVLNNFPRISRILIIFWILSKVLPLFLDNDIPKLRNRIVQTWYRFEIIKSFIEAIWRASLNFNQYSVVGLSFANWSRLIYFLVYFSLATREYFSDFNRCTYFNCFLLENCYFLRIMQIISFYYIVPSNSSQECHKEISPPFSIYVLLNATYSIYKSTTPTFIWKAVAYAFYRDYLSHRETFIPEMISHSLS